MVYSHSSAHLSSVLWRDSTLTWRRVVVPTNHKAAFPVSRAQHSAVRELSRSKRDTAKHSTARPLYFCNFSHNKSRSSLKTSLFSKMKRASGYLKTLIVTRLNNSIAAAHSKMSNCQQGFIFSISTCMPSMRAIDYTSHAIIQIKSKPFWMTTLIWLVENWYIFTCLSKLGTEHQTYCSFFRFFSWHITTSRLCHVPWFTFLSLRITDFLSSRSAIYTPRHGSRLFSDILVPI